MTRTSYSSRIITLLCFIFFLHDAFAVNSDVLTLLSLLTHWTFVPPLINSSWKVSDSNPCSWIGVQCDHTNNLISLNLTSYGIFGQLGPEIGNLYHLQTLLLSSNGFSGKVPLELSNCSLLENLDLSENRFSGKIPYSLKKLQNLRFMSLSANLLTGEIPDSLFEIPSLEEVSLHSNMLSGPIHPNIGNLTQLLRLYLYGNMFSGTIPSSIGNCSKLEDLELSFNRLRGEIPVSIWRIPSLVNILVHNNSLSGELPFEMTNLKYLKNISLFDNQFSGVIPQSLGINSSIVKLDCMNNKFTGTIPPNLCFGKHLLVLNMGINQLQGSIPSDVGRCATLTRLFLNENNFTGSLPKFESNLNLKYMDMSKNNISGPIPSSLGNSANLTYINLSTNKFTRLIPLELGNLVNLVILDLAHNNLQGSLPLRLSNCTKMDRFDVGFNFLNGSLPSSLRSWTNITTLVLRENHFTGSIPRFLAELHNLRELQLGGNLFRGEIPRSMGKLHNLFYGLNLSANRLTGDIPSEIRELRLLQSLDISLNNLTGSIDALESLVSLIELNISYNLFNGSVPTGLMKLFYLSPSSFTGNPLLCVSCLSCIKTSYINPCVYKSTDHKGIGKVQIVMIVLGSSILISVVLVIMIHRRFHRKVSDTKDLKEWYYIDRGAGRIGVRYAQESNISGEENPNTLQNLVLQATENLSDRYIIGIGAQGIVYKALLGQHVFAVKKFEFTRSREKQLHMLRKEIEVLGMYKHRNLIKYADYWIGKDYGLVLYEFMQNGSLDDILHQKNPPLLLTWNVRFNIAVGIAEGIAYLHNDCDPPIVHRDIKPKNILINDNMEPIISDFGTALDRNLYEDSYSYSETRKMLSTIVVGTPGYIAPENAYVIVQSRKSDVYSYGIVLLEIITRKKVVIPCLNDESNVTSLVSWARSVWLETGKIEYIADSYLAEAFPNSAVLTKQVTTMFLLALQCTEKDLRKRPTMKDVIRLYKRDMFKWCDEEECVDTVAVAADTSLQPYSPNISPIIPVVSIDHHIHGESIRAAAQRHREVTFTADAEPMDYSDFSFRQDIDQFQSGFCVEDDWSRTPITYIDGLLVKLMENGNTKTQSKPKETSNSADQEHNLKTSATNVDISVSTDVKSLGYNDLKKATRNFRQENLIGGGGFGFVYKGWIDENTGAPTKPGKGIVVAIKRLNPEGFQGHKEWLAEVNYLGQLHHENLVKLIGYCSEGKNRLLVYEFMQKGSLDNHLFRKGVPPISWMTRINIAIGVAKGLTFLHSLDANVIYRDLKSSNILLDSDFNPNLSDFGLARDGPTGDNTHVSTQIFGTPGYAAPEYVATGHLTPRSDVYSFGVVLLELLTGRRVVDYCTPGHTVEKLVDWAMPFLSDSRRILRIMDTKLGGQYSKKGAQAAAALVLKCLHTDPKHRPTMVNVLSALETLHSSNALPRTPKSGADNHHHATKHSSHHHHHHSHKSITNNTRKH